MVAPVIRDLANANVLSGAGIIRRWRLALGNRHNTLFF